MFKLPTIVLLFTIISLVYSKPGYLHSAAIVSPIAAIPSAISHTSRVDVHSTPIVVANAAPLVATLPAIAPLSAHLALPVATSYSTRFDLHSAPLIATYGGHPW